MSITFAERVELDTLVKTAKLEQQDTVSIPTALLEALIAVPATDEQTAPLPLA